MSAPPKTDSGAAQAATWAAQLDAWIRDHSLCGYDPFDIKQHPWIRAAQPYPLLRKGTTALCDVFPNALRALLRIEPQHNAKAYALVALGRLRRFQATQDEAHLEGAFQCLDWLRGHATPGYAGLCWGYPFDVHAKGLDTPHDTPIVVVSAMAGEAFALAHDLTGDATHVEAVRSIAEHVLADIPRMRDDDGTVCFAYTPGDRRRVHNANLHAAAHLYRAYRLTGEASYREQAEPALRFTLDRQRDDGAWPYGEYDSREPFEGSLMRIIDHHHTGFVLRSLHEIYGITHAEGIRRQIERGYAYYRNHLFEPDGMPVNDYGRYPVDIHACAEAILCPAVLADWVPDALDLAARSTDWTYRHLRDPRSGAVYHRKYPFFTARLIATRWGIAWVFRALCEYVFRAGYVRRP